jgi:hypothetical protein
MEILIILVILYMLPSIAAICVGHKDTIPIIILNIFLGWLFIPWVICLVWSAKK